MIFIQKSHKNMNKYLVFQRFIHLLLKTDKQNVQA
jgi:hypothetical protein